MSITEPNQSRPEQGGCLTAFLIYMLAIQTFFAIFNFMSVIFVRQYLPDTPIWVGPVFGIISIVKFVFIVAVWKWKRWGMYGFAILEGITFIANVIYSDVQTALLGLVSLALLAFLLREVWSQME